RHWMTSFAVCEAPPAFAGMTIKGEVFRGSLPMSAPRETRQSGITQTSGAGHAGHHAEERALTRMALI
ncbi:MAG: hypothetical protein ACYDHM_16685, partial [Acidiferrobacterales bacterium]